MDKSEMEDAGKDSHEALDNVKESKDSLVDQNVEPEAQKDPSSSNTDTQNSIEKIENDAKTVLGKGEISNTEIESQEQNNAKTEVLEVSNAEGMKDDKTDATKTGPVNGNKLNSESEDENKTYTESEDENKTYTQSEDENKTNTQLEDENKTNTQLEDENKTNIQLEDENKTNTQSDDQNITNTLSDDQNITNTQSEDQSKTNAQSDDQNKTNTRSDDQNMNNTLSEDQNMTTTQSEDQNKTNPQSDDQNVTNTQSDDQNMTDTQSEDQNKTSTLSEVLNKTNTQSEDQNNTSVKSEIKDLTDIQDPEKEQNPLENGKNIENSLQSKTEDQIARQNVEGEKTTNQNGQLPLQLQASAIPLEKKEVVDEGQQTENEGLLKGIADQVLNKDTMGAIKELKEPEIESSPPATALSNEKVNVGEKTSKVIKHEPKDTSVGNKRQSITPDLPMKYSTRSSGHSGEASRNVLDEAKMPESEDGTPEEQAAFMKELENFYRERAVEFKPPKFYGQPLNCLKLWRAVIKLGGYDRVTGSKMWRQVGESFHPPKTCTTVSWTFRIFYEKSLLEYERYQRQNGDLQLPAAILPEPSSVDNEGNGYQAPGSGRARRDAAARAMQGWHVQRLFGYGEVGEPIIKDKNLSNMPKRENKLKSIGSLKQKRPNEIELPVKAQRTETSKQLVTNIVDVGAPADWVKINVRETKDSFEVYALVPGLLREEVRVQSDPAGRLVITGQPEQPDNPWGITPFKKVVSLPARIDPLQTSAVVSLHGRLFVRVPFEQSNI